MHKTLTIILLLILFIPGCIKGAEKIRLTPERGFVVDKEERATYGSKSYSTSERRSSFSVELVE